MPRLVDSEIMPSHFITFVLIGFVQIATAFYGGFVSVKSLPPGEKRLPHLLGFAALGVCGVILTIWIGFQSYDSERRAAETQNRLLTELAAANQKLENQSGQLATIAGILKINSNDPAVLAAALAQALHPPEKLPCLKPVHFTATQRHSPFGYETLIQISNPNGVKAGTTFQFFFNTRVNSIQSPEIKMQSGSSGGDIGTFTVREDIPKGKPLTFLARGSEVPAQTRCIDRFDPASQSGP